ncbi:MAG: hypothetical protein KF708_13425 [Pirellulales bacterium]|nr:hypothetical protein [Pirellulales bacterium]
MACIGATLSGLERTLLHRLAEAQTAAADNALHRVASRSINTPVDNPRRFVALSDVPSPLAIVGHRLANVTAANSLVSQAELTLDQIHTQVESIRRLALDDEDGDLTAQERGAQQARIDAAIKEINRLAGLRVNGRRVLDGDGSAELTTSGHHADRIVNSSTTATLAIPSMHASRLGGPSGMLTDLALGGAHAGLGANASRAIRIVDEALARIDLVTDTVRGFARAAIDSSAALLEGLDNAVA